MANVIPLRPAPVTLDQYLRLLDTSPIGAYSELVPLDALPSLQCEIEARLRPAQSREVNIAVAALGASLKIPGAIENPEKFGEAMAIELAEYPADILKEAVGQARRTLDWFPSIKEMIAICEQLIEPRRERLRAIRRTEAEHHRRQQEAAERKVQAEREAQRAADKIRRLQGVEERARELLGNDAPLPGDIELADSISKPRVSRAGTEIGWLTALESGEFWAAQYCRLMALAERTRQAIGQGRIAWNECLAIGKLISRDEAAARSEVEKAEAREARPQYEARPPERSWDAVGWRIRKVCGLDVPCSKDPDVVATAAETAKHLTALAGLADVREILDRQVQEAWASKPHLTLTRPAPAGEQE
jgi:hypothetical protein